MELMYTAEKRSPNNHKFAFAFASLPSTEEGVVDGNNNTGVLDGNDTA